MPPFPSPRSPAYGPVLRAISDASSYDGRVEEMYRFGLLERLVTAVAGRVARDVEAGLSPTSTRRRP